MPQFARPDADTTLGNYQDNAGGTSNIFQAIDEAIANDADFIRSPQTPVNEVYVCRLSDVVDPVLSTGHTIRARVSTDVASGGETLDFLVELRQGYVSEGSQGTLIASQTQNGLSGTGWVDVSLTLSGGQADSITDYTALFLRMRFNKP